MAKIYELKFCSTCRKPIREADTFTRWENAIYCEPCFDEYMELVTPKEVDRLKSKKD